MADIRCGKESPRLPYDYFEVPASARIWNYWLGGHDNYPVDREAGDAWERIQPEIRTFALQSRRFLARSVRYLAGEAGMRQFLDIGAGLPAEPSTHEVAHELAPESKIVYLDNDPLVIALTRALLASGVSGTGSVNYLDADLRDVEWVISGARRTLDFAEPIAVMFMGVLGHVVDFEAAPAIVAEVMDAVPSGSHLAICDGTDTDTAGRKASEKYAETGAVAYHLRSPEQMARYFGGLQLVEPGLVPVNRWRPDPAESGATESVDRYGGVARKP